MSNYLQCCLEAYPDLSVEICELHRRIIQWKDIYRGIPPWRTTKKSGLYPNGSRRVAMLNCGKSLCDELAALALTEKPTMAVSVKSYENLLKNWLNATSFFTCLERFLPCSYALGGGAIRLYVKDGRILPDYVPADRFFPVAWIGGQITEAIFVSRYRNGKTVYTILERHGFDLDGNVMVSNKAFKSCNAYSTATPCNSEECGGIPETVIYKGVKNPIFSYFLPAGTNNLFENIPVGMSAFGSCIDTLKAIDTAFDSFTREFVLGAKRIIVPSSAIRTVADLETGKMKRYFDANDEVFVALKCDEPESLRVIDNTVELRIEEHISALTSLFNILCSQVGLSKGALSFDDERVMRTATEVISQQSRSYRTMKKMQNSLGNSVSEVLRSVIALECALRGMEVAKFDVSVQFRDNVIEDDRTKTDEIIKLVNAGLMSKKTAVQRLFGLNEKDAAAEAARLS